jgi:hypothetical protein
MRVAVLTLALLTGCFAQSRSPVLVELFTSEGCSTCPPADQLLESLDSKAIVLSEHVDYWDEGGWKDRFSSHANTLRQEAYGRIFHLESVYTPQMVVDGETEFSGGDSRKAADAITKAASRPKAAIRISRLPAGLRVEVSGAPANATVYLALADNQATSQVAGGENGGRQLHHIAVMRSLQKLGTVRRGAAFQKQLDLPAAAARQRVVVFLQDAGPGRISGAVMLPPAGQ